MRVIATVVGLLLWVGCGDDDAPRDGGGDARMDAPADARDTGMREDRGDAARDADDTSDTSTPIDAAEDVASDTAADASDDAAIDAADDADATPEDAMSDADAMPREYPPLPSGLGCSLTEASAIPGVCTFEGDCGPNRFGVRCSEETGSCVCLVNAIEVSSFAIPRSDYCSGIGGASDPVPTQLALYECGFPEQPEQSCGVTMLSGVPGACYFDGSCGGSSYRIVCSEGGDYCECSRDMSVTHTEPFTGMCFGAGGVDGKQVWVRDCDFPWST